MSDESPSWTGQFGNTMFGTRTRVSVSLSLGTVIAVLGWAAVQAQEAYSTKEAEQDAVLDRVPLLEQKLDNTNRAVNRIEDKLDTLTTILLQEHRVGQNIRRHSSVTTQEGRAEAFSSEE